MQELQWIPTSRTRGAKKLKVADLTCDQEDSGDAEVFGSDDAAGQPTELEEHRALLREEEQYLRDDDILTEPLGEDSNVDFDDDHPPVEDVSDRYIDATSAGARADIARFEDRLRRLLGSIKARCQEM
ncbi:hypothetical protein OQA88_3020 [Cercophora sp. LCS_1]